MTRKDYQLIAESILTARKVQSDIGEMYISVAHLVNTLATDLEIDNPRFNRARFLNACGVK